MALKQDGVSARAVGNDNLLYIGHLAAPVPSPPPGSCTDRGARSGDQRSSGSEVPRSPFSAQLDHLKGACRPIVLPGDHQVTLCRNVSMVAWQRQAPSPLPPGACRALGSKEEGVALAASLATRTTGSEHRSRRRDRSLLARPPSRNVRNRACRRTKALGQAPRTCPRFRPVRRSPPPIRRSSKFVG